MTPLEIGSDIGGSIRVPAAYCGVYGHRPSQTAVPTTGAFPFADLPNPAIVMGVQGPLARSARDLELLFDVVSGPVVGEAVGWRLDLPPARHDRLADFRVAIMPPLALAQPSAAMQGKVEELAAFLRGAGATVGEAMPTLHDGYFHDYGTLLTAITTQAQSREEREAESARLADHDEPFARAMSAGLTLDAAGLFQLLNRRASRPAAAWREFFDRLGHPGVPDRSRRRVPAPDRRPEWSHALGGRSHGAVHA